MQKQSQTFSMKRFGKYALTRIEMDYQQILSTAGTGSVFLFMILFVMMYTYPGHWSPLQWDFYILIASFLGGIIYIHKAFPMLRQKEEMLVFYLTPVSTLEKYIYECIEKIGLFILLFPLLLYVVGNLAAELVLNVRSYFGHVSEIAPLSLNYSSQLFSPGASMQIMSALFLLFSLIFVGTVLFRKYAGIKIAALIGLYMFLSFKYSQYFAVENSWYALYIKTLELNTRRLVFSATMVIVALIVLLYGYFRVKEKEVQ